MLRQGGAEGEDARGRDGGGSEPAEGVAAGELRADRHDIGEGSIEIGHPMLPDQLCIAK